MLGKQGGLDALLHRPPPSAFQRFLKQPCVFLVTNLYNWRSTIAPIKNSQQPITVVCISDTHNSQPSDIPAGDILIHAGDVMQSGTLAEFQEALDWIQALPIKMLIAGNHDLLLDPSQSNSHLHTSIDWGNIIYLNSESTTISCASGRELKVYGSPLTPRHGNWAFQYPRDQDVWKDKIPTDTDILITHGPPKGHLDGNFGCKYLVAEIWRRKPIPHVFGHIHGGYGIERAHFDKLQKVYEYTMDIGGGIWNFGQALFHFGVNAYSMRGHKPKATFVNAAMAGSLKDEQRRRPIVVQV